MDRTGNNALEWQQVPPGEEKDEGKDRAVGWIV